MYRAPNETGRRSAPFRKPPSRLFLQRLAGLPFSAVVEALRHRDTGLVDAVIYKPVAPDELRALLTGSLGGGELNLRNVLRTTKHLAYA